MVSHRNLNAASSIMKYETLSTHCLQLRLVHANQNLRLNCFDVESRSISNLILQDV